MNEAQIRHEATVEAALIARDGQTPHSKDLAQSFVNASNLAELSYAENAFACAVMLATCLDRLSQAERIVLCCAVGNMAIEVADRVGHPEPSPPEGELN